MFGMKGYKLKSKFLFLFGIFLLPSAPFFSAIFLLISLIISFFKNGFRLIKDRWNYIFIISAILMIFISLFHFLNYENLEIFQPYWDPISSTEKNHRIVRNSFSSFIGLANWIPLFFCFIGFQPYLRTSQDRKLIMKIFVAGSVPVLISGFAQYFFKLYGPFELFNGLIIWFQKPNENLTGLFNNQNYAGCWLNIVWPFSIAIFFEKTKNIFRKGSSILFMVSLSLASFLTFSRNAWGGLLLTIPLVLGIEILYWFLPLVAFLILLIIFKLNDLLPQSVDKILNSLLPIRFDIFSQFTPDSYNEIDTRITIINFALKMIFKNPLLGWGAASFPIYYLIYNDVYKGHAHNIFIDLSFNYGIIVSILIFTNILIIVFFTFKNIYLTNSNKFPTNYFERAWCTSFLVLFLSQMFDVQYYDLRISITFWILLAGMKCISNKDLENKSYTNLQIS
jgi:O-antigen ligase